MRALILIEFALAYCVSVMFLGYGIVFGVFLLFAAVVSQDFLGFFGTLFSVIGGSLGLWASVQLLSRSLNQGMVIATPFKLKLYLVFGTITLIAVTAVASEVLPGFFVVAMLLPIPVALHMVYLNRGYMWPSS